ncbi:hypothetical protein DVH24_032519 [Malus domestica]|uniref:Inhibitor I9 domain-containing protein n=1 Tax=Malus domestica TaxID=3750 RepID=A0A498J8H0_MALDO|nr:hypothetical protein DVH24_032519 [Malus domestica]
MSQAMRPPTAALYLLSFLLSSLVLHTPTFAIKKSYVVYLGSHSHPPNLSELELNQVTDNHHEFLGSFLGSHEVAKESMFYSYTRHINGFAATLEEEEAAQIAKHPKVVSVFLNQGRKLHTTRSWDFLGLEQDGVVSPNSIWKKARYGEDSIIGNLDTGAWPESKSFSDEGYGPIPSKWKGICQNETDSEFHCNRYPLLLSVSFSTNENTLLILFMRILEIINSYLIISQFYPNLDGPIQPRLSPLAVE